MQTFNLDITVKRMIPLLNAKQRDVGTKILVNITDNGNQYIIPDDVVWSVWFSGAGGNGNYTTIDGRSAFAVDGSAVTVELSVHMLNKPGLGKMSLVMNSMEGTQLGLWNIPYYVECLPGANGSAAENYYTAFHEDVIAAKDAANRAEEAAERAVYFNITDDGVLSLKAEYQSNGSKNAELPKHLIIPETVAGVDVTAIAEGAFQQNMMIESISIPSGITAIPDSCFNTCVRLAEVYCDISKITSIGEYAFYMTAIKEAVYPNLDSLSDFAFGACKDLVNAHVGNVTTLPLGVFMNCDDLRELKSNGNIKYVEALALVQTPNLIKVDDDFFSGLLRIEEKAFFCCGLECDWKALENSGCVVNGYFSTPEKLNPKETDFWSDLLKEKTFKECENPLPTLFYQGDKRWRDKQVGTMIYGGGCFLFTIIHAYCALNGLELETIDDFESIVNAKSPGLLDEYGNIPGYVDGTMERFSEALGMTVTKYQKFDKDSLRELYKALADGKYVSVTVGAQALRNITEENPNGGVRCHQVLIYGVRADGKLLIANSSYADEAVDHYSPSAKDGARKYAIPYQSYIHPDAWSDIDENGNYTRVDNASSFYVFSLPSDAKTNGAFFTDAATGTKYRLYVENGELKMEVTQ